MDINSFMEEIDQLIPGHNGMGYFSDHLRAIVKIADEKARSGMRNIFIGDLKVYRELMSRVNSPVQRGNIFQGLMRARISFDIKKTPFPITCQPGCMDCCGLNVAINSDEREMIRKYVKDHQIKIDRSALCVFLDGNNLCQIYSVRPASCSKYFSTDDPAKCSTKDGTKIIRKFVPILAEILWSAVANLLVMETVKDIEWEK